MSSNKQKILRDYINRCAAKIQALYRGHRVRLIKYPILRRLRYSSQIVEALALGWRIRRIMRTKEVKMRIK
jgi:hypothetical protein